MRRLALAVAATDFRITTKVTDLADGKKVVEKNGRTGNDGSCSSAVGRYGPAPGHYW